MKKSITAANLLLLFLLFTLLVQACSATSKMETEQILAQAQDDLNIAYFAVAEAQGSGANISELLNKLKLAGNLLAEANNSYRIGDYAKAYSYAMNCSETLEGVADEAASLKAEAEETQQRMLLITAGFSAMALGILLIASFFGWKFLKKKHFRQILETKPEV